MAVRIYALAKELKIDSIELVDVCAKVGIKGKGSALASLSEDEVTKLRDHFANPSPQGGPAKAKGPAAPAAPERPSGPARVGKMPVISTSRPQSPLAGMRKSKTKDEPPVEEAVAEEAAVEEVQPSQPEAAEAQAETSTKKPAKPDSSEDAGPRSPGPLAGVMRREEYVGPGHSGKMPTIGGRQTGNGGSKPAGTPARGRPVIKLAPIPAADQPASTPSAKKDDAPVQKPDMRLPADALKAGKSGAKPLAAHLRRHEESLESAKRKGSAASTEGEGDAKSKGRRGKGKSDTPMLGGREQRQLSRQRQPQRRGGGMRPRRSFRRTRKSGVSTAAPRKDKIALQLPCTVREFSEAAGVPAVQILRFLMDEGVMTTITSLMDPDLTELVAAELEVDIILKEAVTVEDQLLADIREREDTAEDLVSRPPVITFLGHVDHGKTSLLDRIIDIDVVSGESGGITQHIRAYSIEKDGQQISFVDTPGHEAFTEMRARGANVTDIAVLVVAADDGVMPQTEEAISHGRAAEVPIVVALNKTDLPGVDINRAMQGLSANDLLPSEWGGDVEVIKTSAITGDGIDDLLDTLLTVAELHEYKANPNRPALGTCLEAQQETGRGVVSKLIVQNGTLRVGDVVVCGESYGKIKAMYDTLHPTKRVKEAGPSIPVNVTGFDTAPGAGEHFYVLDDIADARTVAESRAVTERTSNLGVGVQHVTLENLFDRLEGEGDVQTLNLILRADVRGSIEAIQKELEKLDHPEVKIKLLQCSVGGVTEADVTLADASDAIIMGFNVVPDEKARVMADKRGVQIKRYEVIYKITEDLKAALEGMLVPEEREVDLGRALVQRIFKISRIGTIAGCRVLAGTVVRNARARVIRDSTIIGDYSVDTLRREKDDSKEVREGMECGIKLAGFNDVKEGDIFEVYKVEEIGRSFDETNN
ncbi:MAG: translation initiation factor IF-2 [Planctomycetes bacterium]|nr:translation initiation factor IF-2 [Planctomycetota bacterium]